MRWTAAAVIVGLCTSSLMAGRAIAADAPRNERATVTRPAAADTKPLAPAVAALLKEAQAGIKDKEGGAKLREKSDYFGKDNLPKDVTPEAVVATLEKQISGDARVDAYVKWQLLSAVPGQFATELAPRAMSVYRRAPEPYSHPGLERRSLQSALYRSGIMKKENMGSINKEFQAAVDKFNADNTYILKYRNDLYAHLPTGGDTMMAGLEDIFVRVRHGVSCKEFWDQVTGSMQGWSVTAEGRQREAVIAALTRLLSAVRSDQAKPYTKVEWSDDPKSGGLHWHDEMALWDKPIQDQIDSLREAAKLMESAGFKDKK